MGIISRGIKNAFRNGTRTVSVIFILAISVSLALIMLLSLKTVQEKIASVKSSFGNTITVSPAGMRGFEGGGTLLTSKDFSDIKSLDHIQSVTTILSGRLTTIGSDSSASPFFHSQNNNSVGQTSLSAPEIESTTNDNSSNQRQGRRFFANGQDMTDKNFSMPITVTGINDISNLSSISASSFAITSGSEINLSGNENVAMLGKSLAEKNNLTAGQTFTAYGETITVKGIFDAGNTFANSALIMPIATIQKLSGETDQINSMILTTDSVDSLSSVQSAVKEKLGDNIDVTTSEQSAESTITPLENIKTISLYSLIGALVGGAIIILLTMTMIVRERRREIGVLKAIGSSNAGIMAQFTVESLVLTILSSVVGTIFGLIFSNPILKVLISSSESSSTSPQRGVEQAAHNFGGGTGQMIARMGNGINGGLNTTREALTNLHAVVGWDILLYGLIVAIVIAIIGSAIPSFFIAKIRPAEVMRQE